jgi:hypothetical protein
MIVYVVLWYPETTGCLSQAELPLLRAQYTTRKALRALQAEAKGAVAKRYITSDIVQLEQVSFFRSSICNGISKKTKGPIQPP